MAASWSRWSPARAAGDLAERCQAWIEAEHPGVDVLVYDGGQERYPLLLAVE